MHSPEEYFEHVPEGTPDIDWSINNHVQFYPSLEALNPPPGVDEAVWIELLGHEGGEFLPISGNIAAKEAHEAKI